MLTRIASFTVLNAILVVGLVAVDAAQKSVHKNPPAKTAEVKADAPCDPKVLEDKDHTIQMLSEQLRARTADLTQARADLLMFITAARQLSIQRVREQEQAQALQDAQAEARRIRQADEKAKAEKPAGKPAEPAEKPKP